MMFGEIIGCSKEYNIETDLHEVGWGAWNGLMWLWVRTGEGLCECGNEISAWIKCGKCFRLAEDLFGSPSCQLFS